MILKPPKTGLEKGCTVPDKTYLVEIFERESPLGPLRVEFEELIRMCSVQKTDVILDIITDNLKGHIYFEDGNVIHAVTGQYTGEKAFNIMHRVRTARFKVRPLDKTVRESISKGVEQLLTGNEDATG
ncbi:DUF4388 domain-containing protein [candidate division WOR-3 bacterium]|uniref:DUF4388 domain-containing protein n=1 Tax=candidate division WOR-3 bacterium TaxID=2052148 RepID=A0A9D5K8Q7_UNCW3|nr:DUF4388 domain-containing protein [candidate division WOR-3 bacterium]MBD3364179.1 DUF4388 domain-containing protein [candidate division WOR-3 bacterium]